MTTVQAFAAIRSDGSVVTWGFAYLGLGARGVNLQIKLLQTGKESSYDMQMLVATCCIGLFSQVSMVSVVSTHPLAGGNSSAVQSELVDVKDPKPAAVWQGQRCLKLRTHSFTSNADLVKQPQNKWWPKHAQTTNR